MEFGMRTELDISSFPPGGFRAGEVSPPREIGRSGWSGLACPVLCVGAPAFDPDTEVFADVRISRVPAAEAPDHIRQTAMLDIVWLAEADAIEGPIFSAICKAADARRCDLVCETSLPALDGLVATIPATLSIQFLVDPDSTDRLVALAAARRTRYGVVHDIARDDAMERIDRLQEEVARISRLLGDLAGQRSALPGTPSGFARAEDFADYTGQVRSPPRDYTAIPRSFVPEERAIERQRAKAVRRVLRQRRMREQYFPADLFADPAWDMLLDLYAARLERQPVSVSSLCIAAAVPATTALRWIKTMTDAGLFLREADPHDGRRIFIGLAEGAFDSLARYFEALEE